ncbi:hypothetical protein EBZ80_03650 [bacterium]|nr:hypothetical protein [bacterium]
MISYATIRSFLEKDGIDVFYENPNYRTSVYLYLFHETSVEYEGQTRFVHPIGNMFRPLLPPHLVDTVYNFRLVLRFLPDDTITVRVDSQEPGLFGGNAVFDREGRLTWERVNHLYQDELQTDYTAIVKMPLGMIIEDDLRHFLDHLSSRAEHRCS